MIPSAEGFGGNFESRIPERHLLRRVNPTVTGILAELRAKLEPFYSEIGRPSIDPELMIRMLIVGYCFGIRFERKLCEEVELRPAYRWFCRLDLDAKVPDHSTFSVNRHGRFRDSDIFRQAFGAVLRACMDAGLDKGEGFAVDASSTGCHAGLHRHLAHDQDHAQREEKGQARPRRATSKADATFRARTRPGRRRVLLSST